jgi:hypothetical protein
MLFYPHPFVRNVNENHEEICLVEEIFLALKMFKGRHLFKSCLTALAIGIRHFMAFREFCVQCKHGCLAFSLGAW